MSDKAAALVEALTAAFARLGAIVALGIGLTVLVLAFVLAFLPWPGDRIEET